MSNARRTQIYRTTRHGRTPRAIYVQPSELGVPTDTTPDPDRQLRAACGCLILASVAVVGLVCGGALFIATALMSGW